jgi:hypothetical protein
MQGEKEVMNSQKNPTFLTFLRRASPGADLPTVPLLDLGGERDHARHGSHPWTCGCRAPVQRGQAVTAASILQ